MIHVLIYALRVMLEKIYLLYIIRYDRYSSTPFQQQPFHSVYLRIFVMLKNRKVTVWVWLELKSKSVHFINNISSFIFNNIYTLNDD